MALRAPCRVHGATTCNSHYPPTWPGHCTARLKLDRGPPGGRKLGHGRRPAPCPARSGVMTVGGQRGGVDRASGARCSVPDELSARTTGSFTPCSRNARRRTSVASGPLDLRHAPLPQTQSQLPSLLDAGPLIKRLQNSRIADLARCVCTKARSLSRLRVGHGVKGWGFYPPVDHPPVMKSITTA